jgi:hypothetical protein
VADIWFDLQVSADLVVHLRRGSGYRADINATFPPDISNSSNLKGIPGLKRPVSSGFHYRHAGLKKRSVGLRD